MTKVIYTIGHSNLELDAFVKNLKRHKILVLIDIRSQPFSSFVKHFNKEILKKFLIKNSIDYYYGGNYLGGKPADDSLYTHGKVDYEKIRNTPEYKKGLRNLKKLTDMKNVVLMCSEEDPAKCHRNLLLSDDLHNMGYEIRHIRKDGSYEVLTDKSDTRKTTDKKKTDRLSSSAG